MWFTFVLRFSSLICVLLLVLLLDSLLLFGLVWFSDCFWWFGWVGWMVWLCYGCFWVGRAVGLEFVLVVILILRLRLNAINSVALINLFYLIKF